MISNKTVTKYFPREIKSIFDNSFDELLNARFPEFNDFFVFDRDKDSYPKLDVLEYPEKWVIEVQLNNLKKEDVSIQVDKNILSIRGQKEDKRHDEDKYVYREIKHSSFSRSLEINTEIVDIDQLTATFNEGYLIVTIPKKSSQIEKGPRRIVIE